MSEDIRIDAQGGLLRIVISKQERRNAISDVMMHRMREALEVARADLTIRLVLIEAEGRDFSAGGDIKDIAPILRKTAEERREHFRDVVAKDSIPLFAAMDAMPQPIVVACRGHVIGAAVQMAAVADLVIASETASFCIPQVNLAHTVDHGESFHLPRKVGLAKALQMCLLAERINGTEAERIGLANWVVADDQLEAKTREVVDRLLASPPVAVRGMKSLLKISLGGIFADQVVREVAAIGDAVATEDFVEAIRAFGEKRAPVFTGR